MNEPATSDGLYIKAAKGVFWVFCLGIFVFATLQMWPLMREVFRITAPFILGLILAYLFHPVVLVVQHRLKLGRAAGIGVVAIIIITIFFGFFAILIPTLYQQVMTLIDAIAAYFTSDTVNDLLLRFLPEDQDLEELKATLLEQFEAIKGNLGEYLNSASGVLQPVAAGSAGAARGTFSAILSVFSWIGATAALISMSVIVTFYILIDMDKVPAIVRRMLPEENRAKLWDALIQSDRAVGGFLRGQMIACTGVGILAVVVLLFAGLNEYAVLIGFVAGAVNFIPYLGPTMGATPAIIWALFTGDLSSPTERFIKIGIILGGFAIIQMVDGFIFQPFIVGKQAALHPLTVMLALVLGAQFGVTGMIVAVPVACVVQVFFVQYYWKDRTDFLTPESNSK